MTEKFSLWMLQSEHAALWGYIMGAAMNHAVESASDWPTLENPNM
jgi:hypothetical protein